MPEEYLYINHGREMYMGKKRNKKAIIVTALFMLAGILLILTGLFGDKVLGLFTKTFDHKNIKPEDLGSTIETNIMVFYYNLDLKDKELQLVGDINDEESALILVDLSGLSESDKSRYYSKYGQHITIQGRLRAVDDAEFQEVSESFFRYYDPMYYEMDGVGYTLEEFHQMLLEPVLHYCIEIKTLSSFDWTPFTAAGICLFVLSLIVEICFIFKLKKRIVLPIVFAIMIAIPVILFFNHIRTILSVKKVTDGFYTMNNLLCTDTQGMLASESGSVSDLANWIMDNHMYGIRYALNEDNMRYGCAAFSAVTPEGDHIFGRNFDYAETDAVLVHSNPDGAYESIGVADLGVFDVGQTYNISPDSPVGRLFMAFTPYIVVDGMNEKGVGAGILELTLDETHQDNGKPDLLIYCAIRGILDTCASVDEALALLESYDIHSDLDVTYHLFITDRSGRYVVVEWLDGKMVTTEYPCCTNSVIAPGEYYDMGEPDDRLCSIEESLGSDSIVTEQQAMTILTGVVSCKITEWSCVYNLDDFTVSICLDKDNSAVYTFSAKNLG